MSQKQTHHNCKHFSHKNPRCPHMNNDIMKRATQLLDNYDGEFTIGSFPTDEEIDKICNNCNAFTQK
jgi:hypothetical protein